MGINFFIRQGFIQRPAVLCCLGKFLGIGTKPLTRRLVDFILPRLLVVQFGIHIVIVNDPLTTQRTVQQIDRIIRCDLVRRIRRILRQPAFLLHPFQKFIRPHALKL